jgi:DNA-binding PadR family transcriptional regulator
MSTLEYHVLLAMAAGPLYGYAIKEAVEAESQGAVTPRAGSLYRLIARLMSRGLVREAAPRGEVAPHPGRERKYYALTPEGRGALAEEARRLKSAAALAERRLRVAGGRS